MAGRYLIYTPVESARDEKRFDTNWRKFAEVKPRPMKNWWKWSTGWRMLRHSGVGGMAMKPGSIQRRLNAIAKAHKAVGLESPTHTAIVANTMKGIRRDTGNRASSKGCRADGRYPRHGGGNRIPARLAFVTVH